MSGVEGNLAYDAVTSRNPRQSHIPYKQNNAEFERSPPTSESTAVTEQNHPIRAALGLKEKPPIAEEHDQHLNQNLWWSRVRLTLREPYAEFWGTFIMVFFGNGSVAQVLLSAAANTTTIAPGGHAYGQYQSISWGWGLGVMLGIFVAGDSGGYLNPAITFANCLYRGLPWKRFPIYLIAQVLGGFVAAGVVYGYYYYAIDNFEGAGIRTVPPSKTATAGIFCTYPQAFMTVNAYFWAEVVETTVLQFAIMALQDVTNAGAGKNPGFLPLGLFFLIFGLGACFGFETGYAMNLARDFGPRLMSYIVGYGTEVWSAGDYYFWVPCVAPFIGCSFGGFLYDVFIYTGPSPINTPWMGLRRLVRPSEAKAIHARYGIVEA